MTNKCNFDPIVYPNQFLEGFCISCQKPFSSENVFTEDGWQETIISGHCEKCFNEITSEDNFE